MTGRNQADLAGEGLVLTGAASVFYGSLGENGPEGRCTALQAVELENPDMITGGNLEGRRMDGAGVSGYRYYQARPRAKPRRSAQRGTVCVRQDGGNHHLPEHRFRRRDGHLHHGGEGGRDSAGRLLDPGPGGGIYHLEADDNPAYAYALTEEEMKQPRWVNLLVWDVEE